MSRILALRHEAAQLLDFPNYAAYALATRMAPSNQAVFDFLRQLVKRGAPGRGARVRRARSVRGPPAQCLGRRATTPRSCRQKLFSISQEELRPYFPLPRVLEGLFSVAEQLFGVKIVERKGVPVWHADVRFFEIHDASGKARAGFYLDACARAKKRAGAWMDDCVGRKEFGAEHTVPVAYLVCNFLPAGARQARAAHPRRRGDDVPRVRPWPAPHADACGLSQHRRHQRRVLGCGRAAEPVHGEFRVASRGARRDGAPLRNRRAAARRTSRRNCWARAPSRRASRPCASSSSRCSTSACTRSTTRRSGARVDEILAEVRDEVGVFAVPEWNRFPHNFAPHLRGRLRRRLLQLQVGRGARGRRFRAFEEQGVFDRAVAQRFLDSILSQGGVARRSTRSSIFAAGRRM